MKNFFLYPNFSLLGVCAFIMAAQISMHMTAWYLEILCYSIAGLFNYIVTYDVEKVVRSIQKRLEAMK